MPTYLAKLQHPKAILYTVKIVRDTIDLDIPNLDIVHFNVAHKVNPDAGYEVVIVDEAQALRGFKLRQGSRQAAAIHKVAMQAKRFIGLTATLIEKPDDYYPLMYFVDQGKSLGRTRSEFFAKYFDTQMIRGRPIPKPRKDTYSAVLQACHHLIYQTEQTEQTEHIKYYDFKVSKSEHDLADSVVRTGFWQGEPISTGLPMLSILLQISSGFYYPPKDKSASPVEISTKRITALKNLLSSAELDNKRVLIVYNLIHEAHHLEMAVDGLEVFSKTKKGRVDQIKRFGSGDLKYLAIHPKSAGAGLDGLHLDCSNIIFYSRGPSWTQYEQAIGRIAAARQAAIGKDILPTVWILRNDMWIDKRIDRAITKKESLNASNFYNLGD